MARYPRISSWQYVERWKQSSYVNLRVLRRNVSLWKRIPPAFILFRPRHYRNRLNLWILCAGLIDTARYWNLKPGDKDLHEGWDGNWRERSIAAELTGFISWGGDNFYDGYTEDMRNFCKIWGYSTDNFAETDSIKVALYQVIMHDTAYVNKYHPFELLKAAVRLQLVESGTTISPTLV